MSVGLDIRITASGKRPATRLRRVIVEYGLEDDLELDDEDDDPVVFASNGFVGISRGIDLMERLGEALRAIARNGLAIELAWRADIDEDRPWVRTRYADGVAIASVEAPEPAPPVWNGNIRINVELVTPPERDPHPSAGDVHALEQTHGVAVRGEPVDDDAIAALERELGIELPLDHADFIAAWGFVRVGPVAVYGIARDPSDPNDIRAARRQLVADIRALCRTDPDRTSADYRTEMYPVLRVGDELHVLDRNGEVCRYDIASDRLDYANATFTALLHAASRSGEARAAGTGRRP